MQVVNMATAFRADGGVVVEITTYPDDVELSDCFHPDLGFRPVPEGASPKVGMTWDGKAFGPPPPAPVVPPRPREATGYALISALSDDAAKSLKARDLSRLSARGQDGIPEQSDFVIRVATKAGTTPDAWFDAVLAPAKA